ncbi:MAG: type I DNA topoisomerase, partial [Patescibacteria group bacterium]
MKLLIVESPTKARTIKNFLGKDFKVESSFGHVRDLPEDKLGVDVEHDFQPSYIIPPKAKQTIQTLKNEMKKTKSVTLATDEDREGESIAWHLAQALGLKNPERIVFHEITKPAIEQALKNARRIDLNLVDAQQARRILDRLVGYKLSPFLWKKVARRLSAGRVQSVAVRLVVDRENEIRAFKPEEYWTIVAKLLKIRNQESRIENKEFEATLSQKDGKAIPKLGIKTQQEAQEILKELEGAEWRVAHIEQKEMKRNPAPPFTTSTLQQAASQKLHFPAAFTMQIAQQLYEMGFITYHRTDSFNLSQLALGAAKDFIGAAYGSEYWAGYFRTFKTKSKGAQEAHEAIRPTYPDQTPEKLKAKKLNQNQYKLYDLLWRRFIACQMAQAVFHATAVDIVARNFGFRSTGQTLKFDGFLKVYPMKFEEAELPPLEKDEPLELQELIPSQHFTEPPPRYNEATLIKALESYGIGRPSTYAPILSTIEGRNYVEKDEQHRLRPTEIGEVVSNLLVKHFPDIVDVGFTAQMEEDLDEIAQGKKQWVPMVKEFYDPFAQNLEKKYEEVSKQTIAQESTDRTCPECASPLVIRLGKYGKFYACSTFPKCKHTESLEKNTLGIKCPKCSKGELTAKRTKRRKVFYGCNRFPDCDFALWDKPTGEKCE